MLASFIPHGMLQRGLVYAAFVVVGLVLLATRDAQRRAWVRLTSRVLPRYPWATNVQERWYRAIRWTFPGLFLLAIGAAGFGTLITGH